MSSCSTLAGHWDLHFRGIFDGIMIGIRKTTGNLHISGLEKKYLRADLFFFSVERACALTERRMTIDDNKQTIQGRFAERNPV